jgi:peptidyl-prolyl cis-trans isomerase SurA
VGRDERVQVSRQALMAKLKKDFSFYENEPVKQKTMALADSTLIKGAWKPGSSAISKETLFSLSNKKITTDDFLKFVQRNQKMVNLAPQKYLEQLYTTFVEQQINDQLEQQIIQKNPDFKILLTEYFEGILLFDVMEREVWKKASDDSVGQLKYFEENAKKYVAGERVRAEIYSASSQDVIIALSTSIEKNDTVAIKKALVNKTIRQEKGVFQKADRPALSKINWAKGNMVTEVNGVHYFIKVTDIVPPGTMTFNEARSNVITDYQDSLEQSWIALLKKKYPVKINTKVKAYVVKRLTQ